MSLTIRDVLTAATALVDLLARLIGDEDGDDSDARTRAQVALQAAGPLIKELADRVADRDSFEKQVRGALAVQLAIAGYVVDHLPLHVALMRDAAVLGALALWDEVGR